MSEILPVHNKIIVAAQANRGTALGRETCELIMSGCAYALRYESLARRLPNFGLVGLNLAQSFLAPKDVIKPDVPGIDENGALRWFGQLSCMGSGRLLGFGGIGPEGDMLIGTTPDEIVADTMAVLGESIQQPERAA